jgi:hypothetical protein
MATLGDDLKELQEQLAKGSLRRAYGSIVGYLSQLRVHFAQANAEWAVSGLYQGCFDMTYFALLPPALKLRGLKIAVVFNYETFGFEVWLAARNRTLQRHYGELLRDNGWSKHRLVEPGVGIDAIIECDVSGAVGLEAPEVLTSRIEATVKELLGDLDTFLAAHDPQDAASQARSG